MSNPTNKVQEKAQQATAMFSQVYAELVNSPIGSNIMDESELYKLASELAIAATNALELEKLTSAINKLSEIIVKKS